MTRVTVDTTGLEREAVLAALYNAASPHGLGFQHYDPRPMDTEWAGRVINERGNDLMHVLHKLNPGTFPLPGPRTTYAFDYVYGRPLKVILMNPKVDVTIYDSKHIVGLAGTVIGILRDSGNPADDGIMTLHNAVLRKQAQQEWNDLTAPYRDEILASYRRGDRPSGSCDHVIASILFPVLN